MTEILLLGCVGIGHYTPDLQFARACLQVLNSTDPDKKSRVTMIVPLCKGQSSCIVDEGETFVASGEWNLRLVDDGQIIQWIVNADSAFVEYVTFHWFSEAQVGWLDHIKEVYRRRNVSPNVIVADMAVRIDEELAAHWNIPSYSFFPSPLLVHWLMPAFAEHKAAEIAAEEVSTEATDDGSSGAFIDLPGFDGISLDLDSETFVSEAALRGAIVAFVNSQTAADQRRAGLICNDITGFYPPGWEEYCKARPDYKIYPVGPLAINFDRRVLSRADGLSSWLDGRQAESVIYISMGSQFDVPSATLLELTKAFTTILESDSSVAIVWAHRTPSRAPQEYEADDLGLPKGWLDQHCERVIVKTWVNQLDVLRHSAIALFITHSGWNGLMEGVAIGHTPLLMLPVNAEQPVNAKMMEVYYKVGERLWTYPNFGPSLTSQIIVDKINSCRTNQTYKDNQMALKRIALSAWDQDGTSRKAFESFLDTISC